MLNLELYPYQLDAVRRLRNGSILCGGVGTGKSRTSLYYVYTILLGGTVGVDVIDPITKEKIESFGSYTLPKLNTDIYIITTAKKRDTNDWENELYPFGMTNIGDYKKTKNAVTIDSWNNIAKYRDVHNSIFIFDEQRVTGKGKWVKHFIHITKKNNNQWVLLSATPGDTWSDYMPVFVANGFYRNKTDFENCHVVFKAFMNYPVIDHYIDEELLLAERTEILVLMKSPIQLKKNYYDIWCAYDKKMYKDTFKYRFDPFDQEPIDEVGKLCYVVRKIVNSDQDRINQFINTIYNIPKAIIFYNFTYELDILRKVCSDLGYEIGEWNGEKHTEVPTSDKWVYLCQYNSASEGWNCITTDTIIFYSLNYSYKMMEQARGRIDRANTPFKELNYYYLRSYATIDKAIWNALQNKQNFNKKAFVGGKW